MLTAAAARASLGIRGEIGSSIGASVRFTARPYFAGRTEVERCLVNLVERLRQLAEQRPDGVACVFRKDGESGVLSRTYAQLDRRARALAVAIAAADLAGKPVLLAFPPGLDFVDAFLGCLLLIQILCNFLLIGFL